MLTFFGSRHCTYAHLKGGLRGRGGHIFVDLSLYVLLYNTNFKNKLKFYDNKNSLTVHIFFNLQNQPHFPPQGKVSQLRKRKSVLCWSIYILLVYVYRGHSARARGCGPGEDPKTSLWAGRAGARTAPPGQRGAAHLPAAQTQLPDGPRHQRQGRYGGAGGHGLLLRERGTGHR